MANMTTPSCCQLSHLHSLHSGKFCVEKIKRFNIFRTNLEKIRLLNLNELGTAVYGITEYTDLSEDEFASKFLGFKMSNKWDMDEDESLPPPAKYYELDEPVPNQYDWRSTKGVVSAVKNQEMCGSCWAFSTTGNVEGVWAVSKNESVSLSEQGGFGSRMQISLIKLLFLVSRTRRL